jgi:hypothetical protein
VTGVQTCALPISIDPLYSPEDLEAQGLDYADDVGYPGEFPYTTLFRSPWYNPQPACR